MRRERAGLIEPLGMRARTMARVELAKAWVRAISSCSSVEAIQPWPLPKTAGRSSAARGGRLLKGPSSMGRWVP